MIPNVKKLGLLYTTSQEYNLDRLKDLPRLVKLEVTGYLKFSWSIRTPSFPRTLKKLTLVGGNFQWKHMVVVGSLPCLEVLKLLRGACYGDSWEITNEAFPQLKVLLIDESYVREWITDGSPFPTLKHLVLRSCRYLIEIPEDVGEIPTLQLIDLDNCTKSLSESAKKIKEDQESYGNDALQVRVDRECQTYFTHCPKRIEETRIFSSPPMAGLPDLKEGCSGGMVAKISEKAPTQLICSDEGRFNEKDFKYFLKSVKLLGGSYVVVAIMGPQSSGKSTLLNKLFSTKFIQSEGGRNQCTEGVWIANAPDMEPPTIVLDLEGSDGVERGPDDTAFERQIALFALAVADVLIINMWCHDLVYQRGGSRDLLKETFEALSLLDTRAPTLLFVIRDKTTTPDHILKRDLMNYVEEIWETVVKPQGRENTTFSDIFKVDIAILSNYESAKYMFGKEVADLRERYFESISPKSRQNEVIPFKSAKEIWDTIKGCKDLHLPSHKVMVATVRCEEIAMEKLRLFESDMEWLALKKAAASMLVFGFSFSTRISLILYKYLYEYDVECIRFEKDVRQAKREFLISEALKVVRPAYMDTLGHRRSKALRSFESRLREALSEEGRGFAESVRTCQEWCVLEFDEQCGSDDATFSSDVSMVRRELLRDIENYWHLVRADKLSQIAEQHRELLSSEFGKQLRYFLSDFEENDIWGRIRNLVRSDSDAAALALSSAVAEFELDTAILEKIVDDLKQSAKELMVKKLEHETQDIQQLLTKRFITAFMKEESVGSAEERSKDGYRKCVKLLSAMAVIRLDEREDNVESVLLSALLGAADQVSPDPLASLAWEEVPPQMTLITPVRCRDIWNELKPKLGMLHPTAKVVERRWWRWPWIGG